ncbi:DUF6431 domain-containing protein [Anaeromicropila populeti]|nr:DUF6431 domain-containing protein [Anaeromicropila populeti]
MIIEFQVFSKDYKKKILNNNNTCAYTCPKCGAKAKFHRHGTYLRSITYLSTTGEVVFESLEILRLKCQSCHSTHSILPWDCIPFQVYSLPVVLFLCEQVRIKQASIRKTVKRTKCTIQTIYQKLNLLKRNLTLIEFYLRQMSFCTATVSVSLTQVLTVLLLPTMKFSSHITYPLPFMIEKGYSNKVTTQMNLFRKKDNTNL